MSSEGFQFKRFYVRHDRCAMKVGTDGVLLGAWAPVSGLEETFAHLPFAHSPLQILDVGTGSGLIALMVAQRCPSAHIDAIDIDADAVTQAADNFAQSPFSDRLTAARSSLQQWQADREQSYDLIVSNPPYFQNSLKNPDLGRKTARHTDSLSFEELIAHSVRLLAENGVLALILPAEAEGEMRTIASSAGLQLVRLTRVYSKESKPARRVLMAFANLHMAQPPFRIVEDALILEDDKGGRSAAYSELCKEFYL
ncbi:MAG: methyltransferase [Paludibacteraceae bacterium]|nr:methyltransferase [Paludibacteraceae bacterium]